MRIVVLSDGKPGHYNQSLGIVQRLPECDTRWIDVRFRSYRVLRGGSWSSSSHHLRISYRFRLTPSVAISDFGFRCAKSVSP